MTSASEILTRVSDAILRVGRTVTFKVPVSGGVHDPATGEVTVEVVDDVPVVASPLLAVKARHRADDVVRSGDAMLVVCDGDISFEPFVGQQVNVGSEPWTVVETKRHDWQDVPVVWELTVRKGAVH